jgi:hypothetical protein
MEIQYFYLICFWVCTSVLAVHSTLFEIHDQSLRDVDSF